MKKWHAFLLGLLLVFPGCQTRAPKLFTFGIFQVNDAPTLNETRKGILQALADSGLHDGINVQITLRNAMGDVTEVQRIAREFVDQEVDVIIALSTQCLQAAMMASQKIPVVFTSVANPQLLGLGRTAENQHRNVTGVASTGPVKQILAFIHETLPEARRVGTLWTPSEINSEYYLQLAREGAADVGLEIIAQPVANQNEVLTSAQMLLNKKIDVLFPVSDNTINASFESIGRLAELNGIPLFAGYPPFTRQGACAALGWDFYEMGYKTGQIAVRIKNGEAPAQIPLQSMSRIRLHLNLSAANKQGVRFSDAVIDRADDLIDGQGPSGPPAER
jgi:putative ABC transport system substrate-binding protein